MSFVVDAVQSFSIAWVPELNSSIVPGSLVFPEKAKTGEPVHIGLKVSNKGEVPVVLWAGLFRSAPTIGVAVDVSTAIAVSQSSALISPGGVLDLTAEANKLVFGAMPPGGPLSLFVVAGHIE